LSSYDFFLDESLNNKLHKYEAVFEQLFSERKLFDFKANMRKISENWEKLALESNNFFSESNCSKTAATSSFISIHFYSCFH